MMKLNSIKIMKQFLYVLLMWVGMTQGTWAQRIVILTPDVAEIVAKLGSSSEVVGIHDFNKNAAYKNTPSIGFFRNFSIEPIMAKKPELVMGSWMAKPDGIYAQIAKTGIRVENVNKVETLQDYQNSITTIGTLLKKDSAARELRAKFTQSMSNMPSNGKRYLLSYDGRYVAGKNTVGDVLIRMAGGINAASNIEGLKPLSREAWLAAKPDVIILAKHNENSIGGLKTISARPEIASSNAVKNKKVQFWDADDFMRYSLITPNVIRRLNQMGR